MLEAYDNLPPMYKAIFVAGDLCLLEVSPHCYMRVGTENLSSTKLGAVEILKKNMMTRFTEDMKAIDWQARQYTK